MQESTITVSPGTELFTRTWLPESNPKAVICLAHGLSDHGGRFIELAETLSAHGFIFIAPDLRGNGKSPGKRGHFDSLEQVMDDLKCVISHARIQFPGLPVFLYGQSMGGNLVINFALCFPEFVDGVVSSSPWLRLANPPSSIVSGMASVLRKLIPSLLINNGLKSSDLTHDGTIRQAYNTDRLIHCKVSVNTFFIIKECGEWAIQHAGELKIPLLLMHGDADQITSYNASCEFASKSNNNLTFKTWPGLFHELHNEPGKEEIIEFVISWLSHVIE
jgi:alpha-beta hydrolase superfamily lysophospholipase